MNIKNLLAVLSLSLFATSAQALPIAKYDITDPVGNCNSGPHGLWTNSLLNDPGRAGCKNYFSFQDGSTLTEFDDGTAIVEAIARNPFDVEATINLTYSGFSTTHGVIKNGGRGTASDIANWHFYSDVVGTVEIAGTTYTAQELTGGTALQIGLGANDKTYVFGASSWINFDHGHSGGRHWDLNMSLGLSDDSGASVAAPPIAALLLVGLMGIVARTRINR